MTPIRLPALVLFAALPMIAACGDPPTRVGQPCQTDAHCGQEAGFGLVCDHRIPGGSCSLFDCTPGQPESCPPGSHCSPDSAGTACRPSCAQVLDCRRVIVCRPDPDCDPASGNCAEQCQNEMGCLPADPALPITAEDVDRVCRLLGT